MDLRKKKKKKDSAAVDVLQHTRMLAYGARRAASLQTLATGGHTRARPRPRRRRASSLALAAAAREAAQAAGALAAFYGAFRAGAALAVRGAPSPPTLDTHNTICSVGVADTRLGGVRARVFYPCDKESVTECGEADYLGGGRAAADAMARLVSLPAFLLAHLAREGGSGCAANAHPLRMTPAATDVLIYRYLGAGCIVQG